MSLFATSVMLLSKRLAQSASRISSANKYVVMRSFGFDKLVDPCGGWKFEDLDVRLLRLVILSLVLVLLLLLLVPPVEITPTHLSF